MALLLLAALALVYADLRTHRFVSFDDPLYVTANPVVREGLTASGFAYALRGGHGGNWHPLTTLSHRLDRDLFGVTPAAAPRHLAVNLALHVATSVLLLLFLRRITGSLAAAGVAAALFALHPLRVESVAWVSSRKDVLSGLFALLAMTGWLAWVRRPSRLRELAVLGALGLGLMAKPTLVVLPVLLLLLDRWPLARSEGLNVRIREKLPLFALAGGAGLLTVLAQRSVGAVGSFEQLSLGWRLAHAPVATLHYLALSLWPRGLAVFYPHPGLAPSAELSDALPAAVGATALLAGLTVALLRQGRRQPWLVVGWLWFLVALLPVIGLVQVGSQALADRYTYLPHMGLALALAGAGARLLETRPRARPAWLGLGLLAAAGLAVASAQQVVHWRDSEALYRRALAVTPDNHLAHRNLGSVYLREGRLGAAQAQLEAALRIRPGDAGTLAHLGAVHLERGELGRARARLLEALAREPDSVEARANLARLRAERGELEAAEAGLREALARRPGDAVLRLNLARVLYRRGRPAAAAELLERILEREPERADLWRDLGLARLAAGDGRAAAAALRRGLAVRPDDPQSLNSLAWILATAPDPSLRDASEALRLARRAVRQLGREDANLLDTLAAAHAARGDFTRAVALQERAVRAGAPSQVAALRARLALYRASRPYRDPRLAAERSGISAPGGPPEP